MKREDLSLRSCCIDWLSNESFRAKTAQAGQAMVLYVVHTPTKL